MKKIFQRLKSFFVPVAFIFITATFSGAYYSDNVSLSNNSFAAGTWIASSTPSPAPSSEPSVVASPVSGDVVLNEFLANTSAGDSDPMPGGEWIELYNPGSGAVDLTGWNLYDAANNALPIISGNVGGGSLELPANGYKVVYRNGYSFSLNNGTDTIKLYNGTIGSGTLKDSFVYNGTPTNKTWARVPDGVGDWSNNHNPTPGGANE